MAYFETSVKLGVLTPAPTTTRSTLCAIMRNIILLLLILVCAISYGQSPNSENTEFVKHHKLILKSTKKFRVKAVRSHDSLVTFLLDSVSFKFSIRDISKVKTKRYRKQIQNKKELNTIRIAYRAGINTILIDSMDCALESLIWINLLGSGKVKEITISGKPIRSFKCNFYAKSSKGGNLYYVFNNALSNSGNTHR